jgi:hypothetical protein
MHGAKFVSFTGLFFIFLFFFFRCVVTMCVLASSIKNYILFFLFFGVRLGANHCVACADRTGPAAEPVGEEVTASSVAAAAAAVVPKGGQKPQASSAASGPTDTLATVMCQFCGLLCDACDQARHSAGSDVDASHLRQPHVADALLPVMNSNRTQNSKGTHRPIIDASGYFCVCVCVCAHLIVCVSCHRR